MKKYTVCLLVLASLVAFNSYALTDSVTRDVSNGDWVYTLQNPDDPNQQYTWRYTPRNQIAPKIKSTAYWDGSNFVYQYKVSNGKNAKHPLAYLWMRAPITIQPDASVKPAPVQTAGMLHGEYLDLLKIHYQQERAYEKKVLKTPQNWRSSWNIKYDGFIEFGWFPTLADDSYRGLPVGETVKGFAIIRPELPGVMFAESEGATKDPMILGGLPETGPIADAVKTMAAEDSVWTPVMVPAIVIPTPYNGAELAKRIKTHVSTWLELGLITKDTLDRLNRSFDSLIAAQTYNNIAGTHAAVREILQEAYSHHRGLNHTKNEEDDDEHDAEPVKRKAPSTVPLHRLAARALSFDLTYLLTRAHIGK